MSERRNRRMIWSSDAATGSVLYDIAEVELAMKLTQLYLRQAFAVSSVTSRFGKSDTSYLFSQSSRTSLKPLIIDLFKHQTGGPGKSSVIYGKNTVLRPEGENIYL